MYESCLMKIALRNKGWKGVLKQNDTLKTIGIISRSLTSVACFKCIWYGTAKDDKSCLQRQDRFAEHLELQHFIKEVNNITMSKFKFDFTSQQQSEFHVEIPPFRASDEPCSSSGHIRITDGDESMFVFRSSSRLIYYAWILAIRFHISYWYL